MIAWLLLLSLSLNSLAIPIHDAQDTTSLLTEKLRFHQQTISAYLTLNSHEHDDDASNYSTAPAPGSAKALIKRNQMKLAFYRPHSYLTPALVASSYLQQFFNAVAVESTVHWPQTQSPLPLFTITQGQLQLTISCLGANVHWAMVARFASRFALTVGLNPATFDAYYIETATSIPVWISLRILQQVTERTARPSLSIPQRRGIPPPTGAAPNKRSIISRTTIRPSLHLTKFTQVALMLPSDPIKDLLTDFYEIIALDIETGKFSHLPDSKFRILARWDFELVFTCDKMVVPWSFIQEWVLHMASWSEREWTGFYEATVRGQGPLSGLVFLIKMQLKDRPLN